MTDPLPPFVFAILFEGAPITCRHSFEGCQEYLEEIAEEDAELYQVWRLDTEGEASADCTQAFVDDWSELFDCGDSDDPQDILRPFPPFIRAFASDKIIAAYRAAQEF